MQAQMCAEDGIESGLAAWERNLPLEDMLCDVSLWLGETALARFYYPAFKLKVSAEVHAVVSSQRLVRVKAHHFKKARPAHRTRAPRWPQPCPRPAAC